MEDNKEISFTPSGMNEPEGQPKKKSVNNSGNGFRKKAKKVSDVGNFYGYPNNRIRRQYRNKMQKKRTAKEIEDKVSPFSVWCRETTINIINGQRMHTAYQNDVYDAQYRDELDLDERVKKSLLEFYKDSEKASAAFRNNKRIQSIDWDKKILR